MRNSKYQLPIYLERGLKYYLLQTFRGLLFIISWALPAPLLPLLVLSIILKLGVFPFRFWVVPILSFQPWVNLGLLSTLIKVPPFLVLQQTYAPQILLLITIIHGVILTLYLLKVKAIIAASRLINTRWIGLLSNRSVWLQFMSLYTIILLLTLLLVQEITTLNYKSSSTLHPSSPFLFLSLCSLAGVPPLTGFSLKWVTLTEVVERVGLLSIVVITILRLRVFFYLSLTLRSQLLIKCYLTPSNTILPCLLLSIIHIPGIIFILILCSLSAISLPLCCGRG